jgi:hypothetical protein
VVAVTADRAEVGVLGNCPYCGRTIGESSTCENCKKVWNDANTCPCCDEPLLADQPWRRRNDRQRGLPAAGGDYVHAWCDDRLNIDGGAR